MISSICLIHPTAPPPSAARFRRARQTVQSGVASLRNASHKGIENNRLLFHPTNVNAYNQRCRCFRTLDEILLLAWRNQINKWERSPFSDIVKFNKNSTRCWLTPTSFWNFYRKKTYLAFHNSKNHRTILNKPWVGIERKPRFRGLNSSTNCEPNSLNEGRGKEDRKRRRRGKKRGECKARVRVKTLAVYCTSLFLPGRKLVNARPNVSNLGLSTWRSGPMARGVLKVRARPQSGLRAATTGWIGIRAAKRSFRVAFPPSPLPSLSPPPPWIRKTRATH